MLDNFKLIHRLSVEEKIRMVVSDKKNHNNDVSYYKLPIISLEDNFLMGGLGFPVTYEETLRSWNVTNFQKYGRIFGENYLSKRNNSFIRVSLDDDDDNLTEDSFFISKYLSHFIQGLSLSNCYACLDIKGISSKDVFNKEFKLIPFEKALTDGETQFVRINDVADIEYINDELYTKVNYFASCSTIDDVVKFLNNQVSLIFYDGNLDELVEELTKRIEKYQNAESQLNNNQIDAIEFSLMVKNGEILSLDKLEEACDRFINILINIIGYEEQASEEENASSQEFTDDKKKENSSIINNILKESIVLLKNDNQLLPLNRGKKVAIIGDVVKNRTYYQNQDDKIIFDEITSYEEINYVGYAHGYLKDMANDEEILQAAIKLLNNSELGVYFVCADDDSKIPQEQIDALNEIKKNCDKPIALVIFSKRIPEMDFDSLCDAIIYAGELKEGIALGVLEVLSGRYNPSAKLPYDVPLINADNLGTSELPLYTNENIIEKYEFGYGMSYTTFEYGNLEIKQNGISFTILNSGDYDGEEVCQLYVQKLKTDSTLSKRLLKGFEKVFIKKGEAAHVFIPFDEFTFRYYDKDKECYGVEGGNYCLYVGPSSKVVRLQGGITLSKSLSKNFDFENNVIEKNVSEINAAKFIQPKSKNPYKKKVAISSCIAGYLDITIIALLIAILIEEFNIAAFVILFVLLILVNVTFALYLVKCDRDNKSFVYTDENATLTNIVDSIGTYYVMDRTTFEKPVKKVVSDEEELVEESETNEEDIVTENEESEASDSEQSEENENSELLEDGTEEVEEELVDISESTLSQEEIKQHEEEEILQMENQNTNDKEEFIDYEEDVTFNDTVSLQQVCESFYNFTKDRGLIVEYISIRSIFSALASSHIILMTSKMQELLPRLTTLLNEFLGNKTHIIEAKPTWNSSFYLTWRKNEEGNYVKTDFVNDVYNSNRLKSNLNIAVLNNVNMSNIELYFKEFIDFSNRPSYGHYMKLNNKQNIKIPNNLSFILIPESEEELDKITSELALGSITIEVFMREEKEVEEPSVPETISYSYFEDLVYYSKKEHFINEESWKKIDEFIEELNEIEEFRIGNKTVIQIERYTSIYIGAGGDEQEALDSVIADKLVPLIKTLNIYHQENGIKTISSLFEKHFGLENISKTIRTLHRNETMKA